jgi:hypothetical protein
MNNNKWALKTTKGEYVKFHMRSGKTEVVKHLTDATIFDDEQKEEANEYITSMVNLKLDKQDAGLIDYWMPVSIVPALQHKGKIIAGDPSEVLYKRLGKNYKPSDMTEVGRYGNSGVVKKVELDIKEGVKTGMEDTDDDSGIPLDNKFINPHRLHMTLPTEIGGELSEKQIQDRLRMMGGQIHEGKVNVPVLSDEAFDKLVKIMNGQKDETKILTEDEEQYRMDLVLVKQAKEHLRHLNSHTPTSGALMMMIHELENILRERAGLPLEEDNNDYGVYFE